MLLYKNSAGQRLSLLREFEQEHMTLVSLRSLHLLQKALAESGLMFSDFTSKVRDDNNKEDKQKLLIFDKGKLKSFVNFIKNVADSQNLSDSDSEGLDHVLSILMRDESKVTRNNSK